MSSYASMASVNQPRYLPNGTQIANTVPGAQTLLPSHGRIVQAGPTRILCVADVRGELQQLNELAKRARADAVIHTGDFGFYDEESFHTIAEKTLKHVAQYSPLISDETRIQISRVQSSEPIKGRIPANQLPLSQLPQFLNRTYSFEVPIYTVWGACEDVRVLEKFRSGEYQINNFHIIDESQSRLLEVGGIKLRLLGLGGAIVMHKLFDNGEGKGSIAGGQGTMWTTFLQIGELVNTANQSYDPGETRVLITHASPAREGLLNQLAVYLKVDFSISAGLHFRYGSSYNEFSVNPTMEHYRGKLAASQASFNDVWETVKSEVEPAVADNEAQRRLLACALEVVKKMPSVASNGNPFGGPGGPGAGSVDEVAFKNMWNFNLSDAAYGWLVLEIEAGRIGTEMRAQGFNFAHRGTRQSLQTDTKPTLQQVASPGIPGPNPYATAPPAAQQLSTQGRSSVPAPPSGPTQQQQQQQQPRSQQQARTPSGVQTGPTRTAHQGPTLATQQSQAAKSSPTPGTSSATSPAAQSANQDAKPSVLTPASTSSVANGVGGTTSPSSSKPNGALSPALTTDATPTKAGQPIGEPGVFVQNVHTEEEARSALPEADRAKIQRIQKISSGAGFKVYFSSVDEATSILNALPAELKTGTNRSKPKVSALRSRDPSRFASGARVTSTGQRGYQSGASDSEGAARGGRGGFRGSRGSGPDRGRGGRSDRGGRGGAKSAAGEGSSAVTAAAASPAPQAADSTPAPAPAS